MTSGGDDDALYGGSSTIALIRHVAHDIQESDLPSTTSNPNDHLTAPEVIRERDEGAAVYPRRRSADDFLLCYWEFIHPLFPAIHKSSFMTRYEELWLPESRETAGDNATEIENVVFSSMLNLIFALGCKFSSLVPSAKKATVADEFYQRSRKLFVFEILDSTSLPLLQLLLLQGIYLQSSRYATRCWNVLGLAIRVAHGLGLHLHIDRKSETQLSREMRRRVWHTCLVLDR